MRVFENFADYCELSKFMSVDNKDDKDSTIKLYLRVRPMNDNELSVKDRRVRSYQKHEFGNVMSLGKDDWMSHFKYDAILGEDATQDHVIDSIYGEKGWRPARTGFVAYGQSGSGKTYTMSGDPWDNDGIIQKFLAKLARDMKQRMEIKKSVWKVSLSMI